MCMMHPSQHVVPRVPYHHMLWHQPWKAPFARDRAAHSGLYAHRGVALAPHVAPYACFELTRQRWEQRRRGIRPAASCAHARSRAR